MEKQIIIVAGGKGLRMGSDLPKQFIPIGGKPVLMHTIEAFYQFDSSMNIILVLPVAHQEYWKKLCETYQFNLPHTIADGGEIRFHSVKNGLEKALANAQTPTLIGVHDGVRPFVSAEVIEKSFEAAEKYGASIPTISVHETVRELTEKESKTVDRTKYRLVQTPQVFTSDILQKAYEQRFSEAFTDDASVVESIGIAITLVEGNRENIKITSPFDLIIAEALLQQK
jgi:2-C-methyl-D-erythritol 4-phosphate cytidylyltransferase